jgi:hypothetical protein
LKHTPHLVNEQAIGYFDDADHYKHVIEGQKHLVQDLMAKAHSANKAKFYADERMNNIHNIKDSSVYKNIENLNHIASGRVEVKEYPDEGDEYYVKPDGTIWKRFAAQEERHPHFKDDGGDDEPNWRGPCTTARWVQIGKLDRENYPKSWESSSTTAARPGQAPKTGEDEGDFVCTRNCGVKHQHKWDCPKWVCPIKGCGKENPRHSPNSCR